MIWWIADIHAGHANEDDTKGVIWLSKRPFSTITEMEDTIVANINKAVTPEDTLVIVGDASFYNGRETREFIARIKCHVILVRGNHDKQPGNAYHMDVTEMKLRVCQLPVIVKHYPFRYKWYRQIRSLSSLISKKYKNFTPDDGVSYLIHGHTHNKSMGYGRQIHVGVDATGFSPVSMKEIISIIQRREYLRKKAKVLQRIADKIHEWRRRYRKWIRTKRRSHENVCSQ